MRMRALFDPRSLFVLLVLAVPTRSRADESAAAELVPPSLIEVVEPAYPEAKKASGESATVDLELTIDGEGHVAEATVTGSAGDDFDAAALEAATKLRFEPARRGEEAIVAVIPFRFTFTFESPAPLPPASPVPEIPPPAEGPSIDSGLVTEIELDVRGPRPPREPTRHEMAREEIRRVPGTGGDVMRAIETLPGVGRPPALDGLLIVRGSAPQDTQVFLDGTTLPYAYHFGGLVSVVPAEMLERLEFYPGNFGTEFGRGMGGIVDLGVRSPRRDRAGGLLQVDALDARMLVETPLGARTRILIGTRRSWIDAWLRLLTRGTDSGFRLAPVYWDWQAVLEHDLSRRSTLRLMFLGADNRLELVSDSPSAADPVDGGRFGSRITFTRVQLRLDSQVTDAVRTIQTLAFGTDRQDFVFGSQGGDMRLYSIEGRSEVRAKVLPWASAAAGLDVQAYFWDADVKIRPYPAGAEVVGPYFGRPIRRLEVDLVQVRPGAYSRLEISPVPTVRIIPGVRIDAAQRMRGVAVDPRLALRWNVVPGMPRTTLKSAVGLYSQPSQPVEALTTSVRFNRALHVSAGVEQEFVPGLDLSIEGFGKRLDDLVVASPDETGSAVGASFTNGGEGRVLGAELLLRYRPARGPFTGWLAYTLSRSERRDDPTGAFRTFEFDQTHILSAVGSVELGRRWTLGGRFRYVTGLPYTPLVGGVIDLDAGAYEPVASDVPWSGRLPDFHQLDLRLEKAWLFGSDFRLTWYLDVRNVYNRRNGEFVANNYDYSVSRVVAGIPLFPFIGIRGEL